MAAITTLAAANSYPLVLKIAGVGTTWQQVTLPPGAKYLTIKSVDACYIAWPEDGAADGGAVSATRRYKQAAGGPGGGGERHELHVSRGGWGATSVFLAAVAATTDFSLELEGD